MGKSRNILKLVAWMSSKRGTGVAIPIKAFSLEGAPLLAAGFFIQFHPVQGKVGELKDIVFLAWLDWIALAVVFPPGPSQHIKTNRLTERCVKLPWMSLFKSLVVGLMLPLHTKRLLRKDEGPQSASSLR